jgi:hypothetical protein
VKKGEVPQVRFEMGTKVVGEVWECRMRKRGNSRREEQDYV